MPELVHLVAQPRERSAEAPPLLLLLHGVGASEQDLFGLAPYADPRFLVVSARAPRRYQWGGFSWFDINWQRNGFSINAEQAHASVDQVLAFIEHAVRTYNADPQRVYLAGFSQGAIVGLGATLLRPAAIAGLVAMSGRWMPELAPPPDTAALQGQPILTIHGSGDQVIPIRYGRELRDYLRTLPVDLTYQEFPMGHEVNMASLQTVTTWLSDQLTAPSPPR